MPPDADSVTVGHRRNGNHLFVGRFHGLFHYHALISSITQRNLYVGSSFRASPSSIKFPRDAAIALKLNFHGCHHLLLGMVELVAVNQQLVVSRNICYVDLLGRGDLFACHSLARVLERRGHKPAILILEYLVDAHFMLFTPVLKTGMINQISASVGRGNNRVVAL